MASRFGPSNDWRRTSGQLNENRTYFNTRFIVYGALMNKGVLSSDFEIRFSYTQRRQLRAKA
jgi:hypothetical protein